MAIEELVSICQLLRINVPLSLGALNFPVADLESLSDDQRALFSKLIDGYRFKSSENCHVSIEGCPPRFALKRVRNSPHVSALLEGAKENRLFYFQEIMSGDVVILGYFQVGASEHRMEAHLKKLQPAILRVSPSLLNYAPLPQQVKVTAGASAVELVPSVSMAQNLVLACNQLSDRQNITTITDLFSEVFNVLAAGVVSTELEESLALALSKLAGIISHPSNFVYFTREHSKLHVAVQRGQSKVNVRALQFSSVAASDLDALLSAFYSRLFASFSPDAVSKTMSLLLLSAIDYPEASINHLMAMPDWGDIVPAELGQFFREVRLDFFTQPLASVFIARVSAQELYVESLTKQAATALLTRYFIDSTPGENLVSAGVGSAGAGSDAVLLDWQIALVTRLLNKVSHEAVGRWANKFKEYSHKNLLEILPVCLESHFLYVIKQVMAIAKSLKGSRGILSKSKIYEMILSHWRSEYVKTIATWSGFEFPESPALATIHREINGERSRLDLESRPVAAGAPVAGAGVVKRKKKGKTAKAKPKKNQPPLQSQDFREFERFKSSLTGRSASILVVYPYVNDWLNRIKQHHLVGGRLDVANVAIKHMLNTYFADEESSLISSVVFCHDARDQLFDFIRLIAPHYSPEEMLKYCFSCLEFCVREACFDIVRQFFEVTGANINAAFNEHGSSLMYLTVLYASRLRKKETRKQLPEYKAFIRYLVFELNANIDLENANQLSMTPLFAAYGERSKSMLQFLVDECGADCNHVSVSVQYKPAGSEWYSPTGVGSIRVIDVNFYQLEFAEVRRFLQKRGARALSPRIVRFVESKEDMDVGLVAKELGAPPARVYLEKSVDKLHASIYICLQAYFEVFRSEGSFRFNGEVLLSEIDALIKAECEKDFYPAYQSTFARCDFLRMAILRDFSGVVLDYFLENYPVTFHDWFEFNCEIQVLPSRAEVLSGLDAYEGDGFNLLHFAVVVGNSNALIILVNKYGFNPDQPTFRGLTALDLAKRVFGGQDVRLLESLKQHSQLSPIMNTPKPRRFGEWVHFELYPPSSEVLLPGAGAGESDASVHGVPLSVKELRDYQAYSLAQRATLGFFEVPEPYKSGVCEDDEGLLRFKPAP